MSSFINLFVCPAEELCDVCCLAYRQGRFCIGQKMRFATDSIHLGEAKHYDCAGSRFEVLGTRYCIQDGHKAQSITAILCFGQLQNDFPVYAARPMMHGAFFCRLGATINTNTPPELPWEEEGHHHSLVALVRICLTSRIPQRCQLRMRLAHHTPARTKAE